MFDVSSTASPAHPERPAPATSPLVVPASAGLPPLPTALCPPTSDLRPPTSAHCHGSPGARPRGLGLLKSLWPIGLILFAMGYLVRAALPFPPIPLTLNSLLFLAVAIGIAATANQARHKISNHAKGARGEELAAQLLAMLPANFTIFHGVMIRGGLRDLEGGADIDHIVLAPDALYVVETKHWHGVLTLEDGLLLQDGILPDRDPIEQTRHAAGRVKRFLQESKLPPVTIIPVLLFTATEIPHLPQNHQNVILADRTTLLQRIQTNNYPPIDADTYHQISQHLQQRVEQ